MDLFFAIVGALALGIMIGGLIENYRARVVWGFPLGNDWRPPRQDTHL